MEIKRGRGKGAVEKEEVGQVDPKEEEEERGTASSKLVSEFTKSHLHSIIGCRTK